MLVDADSWSPNHFSYCNFVFIILICRVFRGWGHCLGIQGWRRGYRVRILSHQSRMLAHSLRRSRASHAHARGSRHTWTTHGSPHGPTLLKGYFLGMPNPLASWALLYQHWTLTMDRKCSWRCLSWLLPM